jgi:hypothetical protein
VKMLTLCGGLCCVRFINPVDVAASGETETSSFRWERLSRFYLKMETKSSLRNVVFLNKMQDNGLMSKIMMVILPFGLFNVAFQPATYMHYISVTFVLHDIFISSLL